MNNEPTQAAMDWAWDAVTQFPGAWREETLRAFQMSLAFRYDETNGETTAHTGEADAALLASAPDLLAALEELVARREWLGTEAPVLERARAAIAKALGNQGAARN